MSYKTNNNHPQMWDAWTFVHFAFGFSARMLNLSTGTILLIAAIYEFSEDWLIENFDLLNKHWLPESKNEAVFDIIVAYFGARVADSFITNGRRLK